MSSSSPLSMSLRFLPGTSHGAAGASNTGSAGATGRDSLSGGGGAGAGGAGGGAAGGVELPSYVPTDIAALNGFEEADLAAIVALAATVLKGHTTTAEAQIEQFASERGVNVKTFRSVMGSLVFVLAGCVSHNLSADLVEQDLQTLGMRATHAQAASRAYTASFVELTTLAASRTLVVNELVDFEWKFGVTASSSQVNKLGTCFLHIRLTLKQRDALQNVLMELSLPQFYQFLQQMQAASRQVELRAKAV